MGRFGNIDGTASGFRRRATCFSGTNFLRVVLVSDELVTKLSSVKCLEHKRELEVGVKLSLDILRIHCCNRVGFCNGKLCNVTPSSSGRQGYPVKQPTEQQRFGIDGVT